MSIGGVPTDRGVTARNQQVISQPTGSAPFSDKSDAVWQKQGSPTCPPSSSSSSLHLLHHCGEMKTNTGGFVPQENPAALNSHRSSQALPQVPVETNSSGPNSRFRVFFPVYLGYHKSRSTEDSLLKGDHGTVEPHTPGFCQLVLEHQWYHLLSAAELCFPGTRVLPDTHIHLCYVCVRDLTG